MRAVRFHKHGGLEVLRYEEVPDPVPGPGELVVRVWACGVNRLDIETRENGAGWSIPLPHISGNEPAGEVAAVGEGVTRLRVGDRVVVDRHVLCGCKWCASGQENLCDNVRIIGVHLDGGYAEYVKVWERNCVPLDPRIGFEEAAALPVSFATAWQMLVVRGRVSARDTVLVLAAGSGLGVAGLQIAKLFGARVIAAAGSDEKLEQAKALGADAVVNYLEEPEFSKAVLRLTDGRGVDLVYENVGAATWAQSLACLARTGRLVTCGVPSGSRAMIDIRDLYRRNISLVFSVSGPRPNLEAVLEHVAAGRLRPVIHERVPLKEAAEAQRTMIERRNFGKILVLP